MQKRIILIYYYTYTYSNNMVEIQYHPIKTIVIHEILKHDLNYFIDLKTQNRNPNTPAPVARWADGILFEFAGVSILTEKLVDEKILNGKIHWEFIEFAEMEEYQSTIVHPQTGATLRVIDNSNNTAVTDAIRWLKKQPQWTATAAA